jgi:hypothetical protein
MNTQLTEFAHRSIPLGDRDVPAIALVDSGAWDVARIYREARPDRLPESPDPRGAHDLFAALLTRNRLEAITGSVHPDGNVPPTVDAIDELFKAATVEDPRRWMIRTADLLARNDVVAYDVSGWWWTRIPPAGPIADEIRTWRS